MKYNFRIFFGLVVCAVILHAPHVEALTLSPVKIEITGNPGQTLYTDIELLNEQNEPKEFYPSYENFEPSGDTGSPYFVGAKDGLATWMQAGGRVSLAPLERIKIPLSITIPKETEPGGYFAAVFFGGQDPKTQEGGEVSIGGRLGVLVFLRVAGDIEEGGGVLEFNAPGGRFFSQLPIAFSYRINNTGGDRIVPRGTVGVKNSFRSTVTTFSANESEGSVLPNSARRFESTWKILEPKAEGFFAIAKRQLSDFHFGWYTAVLDLSWGTTDTKNQNSYHFFIIPWQLLSIVILLLGAGRFSLRKYNQWIIARSVASR